MRSYNPNRPLSPRNAALVAVVAALSVSLLTGGNKSPSPDNTKTPNAQITNKHAKHALHIPRLIARHRIKTSLPKVEDLPSNAFVAVAPNEFVNVDLKGAVEDVKKQYDEYGCRPDTKILLPSVPVYVESSKTHDKPAQVNFSYIPGQKELLASQTIDMPEGVKAQDTAFYAFFDGKRYELPATITSPDPEQEPNHMDDIRLAIPPQVRVSGEPDCDS